MLSDAEGRAAVRIARRHVSEAAGRRWSGPPLEEVVPPFDEPRGVFVTLRRHPGGALRGCIGYPLPTLPLRLALARAAEAAAADDPRFPRVRPDELDHLTVEVSVLTVPERVEHGRLPAGIVVGRDGLIVEAAGTSGLLLPQVGPEMGWSVEQLLDGTCEKAGLPPAAWRSPSVRVRRFEAEVFREARPAGPVARA